jgi:hypothetical protein
VVKTGDKVIFAQGARIFLGTASLDSDPFELNSTQKDAFSHGIEFYKTQYGVMLSDIATWQDPKKLKIILIHFHLSLTQNNIQLISKAV